MGTISKNIILIHGKIHLVKKFFLKKKLIKFLNFLIEEKIKKINKKLSRKRHTLRLGSDEINMSPTEYSF